jgi:hypothetical protein
MSIEQNYLQFNIEKFKSDLKSTLDRYIFNKHDLSHISDYEMNSTDEKNEVNRLKTEMNELMSQLISVTINAIKLTKNKQEILDAISETILELKEELTYKTDIGFVDDAEKELFNKIILELLKTQK